MEKDISSKFRPVDGLRGHCECGNYYLDFNFKNHNCYK